MITNIIILIVLLILSAYFSSAEVAFVTLNDAKVSSMVKRKLPRAKLVKKLKDSPRRLLITILIGNNIVNIAASSFATVVAIDIFDSGAVGIATGVMTLLVLVFGEIAPKSYAANHPKKFAIFAAPFLRLLQIILFPLVILFGWITTLVAGKQTQDTVSEDELIALARAGSKQGNIEHQEGKLIEKLFAFNDITAEDIMTPRVGVVFLNHNDSIAAVIDTISDHPYTRYPVMKKTPDHVVGFIHARDVLIATGKKRRSSLKSLMHPIVTVPKQMPIDDVMLEFQKRRTHIAVVVDEFGGTEGIVTLEDVIEELVGEIADEHDLTKDLIKRVDKDTIQVAGDTIVRDINDFLNTMISGNQLDTIAEIMLDKLQKLPRKGQSVEAGNTICTVLEVKKRRIQRVEIKKVKV